jgi:hypothetical protein
MDERMLPVTLPRLELNTSFYATVMESMTGSVIAFVERFVVDPVWASVERSLTTSVVISRGLWDG